MRNPTIGYCRNHQLNSTLSNCYQLTHTCSDISQEFSVVTEFNYKDSGPRYVWSNVKRLLRSGHIKTLILSELRDAEVDPGKFIKFIEFLYLKNIRLISIKENFDSQRKGAYFQVINHFIYSKKNNKINVFEERQSFDKHLVIFNKYNYLRGVKNG